MRRISMYTSHISIIPSFPLTVGSHPLDTLLVISISIVPSRVQPGRIVISLACGRPAGPCRNVCKSQCNMHNLHHSIEPTSLFFLGSKAEESHELEFESADI